MKITCPREALLAACQNVQGAVAARTTLPILANLKLMAHDDAVILMGTDTEVGIRYELRGMTVRRAGAAILPPAQLLSILRETTDPDISLDADAETTRIQVSTGRFELPGGPPDDFPDVPTLDPHGHPHEITAGTLRTLIKRTAFAAERKESTRWAITGVLWEADSGQVRLVATDTKRLALAEGPAQGSGASSPSGGAKAPSHLIPLKSISILERNLADDGEVIRVALQSNAALFQTERAVIYTRLVEGRFPPYRDIIPKKGAVAIPLIVPEFLARVRQAAIMSEGDSRRVDCHFQAGRVVLSARGPHTGSSEVMLELPEYAGPEVKIAFDPQYLIEMLRAIDGEPTVVLQLTDGQKPAVFRVGEHYTYLVMPMTG